MTALNSPVTSNDIIEKVNELDARDALPSQTGHSGEYLTTNGSEASWDNVDTIKRFNTTSPLLTSVDGVCSWVVTHNLNTNNLKATVYNASTGEEMICDKTITSSNSITVTFLSSSDITANMYRISIIA